MRGLASLAPACAVAVVLVTVFLVSNEDTERSQLGSEDLRDFEVERQLSKQYIDKVPIDSLKPRRVGVLSYRDRNVVSNLNNQHREADVMSGFQPQAVSHHRLGRLHDNSLSDVIDGAAELRKEMRQALMTRSKARVMKNHMKNLLTTQSSKLPQDLTGLKRFVADKPSDSTSARQRGSRHHHQ
mmetsp:Transcript_23114/g.54060  ORF Transcript_23114/g.54060 Transcript_23114/m.54060 type:complete len:184 (-) Transcript_23114:28-579(-)